jgi:hypothetical protein
LASPTVNEKYFSPVKEVDKLVKITSLTAAIKSV